MFSVRPESIQLSRINMTLPERGARTEIDELYLFTVFHEHTNEGINSSFEQTNKNAASGPKIVYLIFHIPCDQK